MSENRLDNREGGQSSPGRPGDDSRDNVECEYLPDGTVIVRTTDRDPYFAELRAREEAELQELLDSYRRDSGVARPVLLSLQRQGNGAKYIPAARRAGVEFYTSDGDTRKFLLAPEDARRILECRLGKQARRLFRLPQWPTGYWSAYFDPDGQVRAGESRTFKDMGPSGQA